MIQIELNKYNKEYYIVQLSENNVSSVNKTKYWTKRAALNV